MDCGTRNTYPIHAPHIPPPAALSESLLQAGHPAQEVVAAHFAQWLAPPPANHPSVRQTAPHPYPPRGLTDTHVVRHLMDIHGWIEMFLPDPNNSAQVVAHEAISMTGLERCLEVCFCFLVGLP